MKISTYAFSLRHVAVFSIFGAATFFSINTAQAGGGFPFLHTISNMADIVVDSKDNLYTYDSKECVIYKFTPSAVSSGYWDKEVYAGTKVTPPALCPGFAAGMGTAAKFGQINALTIDPSDNLYVADNGVFDPATGTSMGQSALAKIDTSGKVSEIKFTAMGVPRPTGFHFQLAVNSLGTLFSSQRTYIQELQWTGFDTVETRLFVGDAKGPFGTCTRFSGGTGADACFGDSALGSKLGYIQSLAFDDKDNLYVGIFNVGVVAKVTPSAQMTLFSGTPYALGTADGPIGVTQFNNPSALAYRNGKLAIADDGQYHPIAAMGPAGGGTLRTIDSATSISATLAGSPLKFDIVDGMAATARFSEYMRGLAIDSKGNQYTTNLPSTGPAVIRMTDSAGNVSTLKGMTFWCGLSPC